MVFGSFQSKEGYRTLNHALNKEQQRQENSLRSQKIIGEFNYKVSTPTYQLMNRIKNATTEENRLKVEEAKHEPLHLQDVSLILHKIMKPQDAVEALQFLEAKKLIPIFQQYKDVFLKRFKGVQKINLTDFIVYWNKYLNAKTIMPEATQERPAIRKEQPTIINYEEVLSGIRTEEEFLAFIEEYFTDPMVFLSERMNMRYNINRLARDQKTKAFNIFKKDRMKYFTKLNEFEPLEGEN